MVEKERLIAEKLLAEEKKLEGPPMTLEEAMQKHGLLDAENPKVMMRQMHKLLEVRTLEDLKKVTREDVAELDELTPAERRSLWLFASAYQTKKVTDGSSGSGPGSGEKSKKSSKKKKNSNDLDSLLSEGVKKPTTKKTNKTSTKHVPAAAAAAASSNIEQVNTSLTALSLEENTDKEDSKEKDSKEKDYTRHWEDPQSTTQFLFRHDLPGDAFSVIIRMMYS